MPSKSSWYRLHIILHHLKQGRRFNTRTLAEELEVSRRTIGDDIEYLRSMGAPIGFEYASKSYTLTEPYKGLPWKAVTGTEVAAMLVAGLALEALGDTPHASVLATVVERLADDLPDTMQVSPDTFTRILRFDSGPRPRISLSHMEILHQAVEEQRAIEIRYYSTSSNEETLRTVEPYTLLCHQGHWYAICYCRLRQGMRDFRVDRMRSVRLTDDVFAIDKGFDIDAYLGPAFGMYREERLYPIHVRFSAYQGRWIREEIWHESQILKQREDGVLDVMMQVTGLNDVARWILSYGGEAEVISPPMLRHRMAVEARRMAAIYKDVPETIELDYDEE